MKELKNVLSLLPASASTVASTPSGALQELQPADMLKILKQLFGDQIDCIDPALSLKSSPLLSGAAQGAGVFLYMQALPPLANHPKAPHALANLTKPIVMLIAGPPQPTRSIQESKERDRKKGVAKEAWKTIVIVPRNYKPLMGEPVNNDQNPLLYYFDPLLTLPANQVPAEVLSFCLALSKGYQVPAIVQGRRGMITQEPLFSGLGFLHGCQAVCDQPRDSAWWALYFAVMAVSRGGVRFTETSGLSLLRLQQVFYPLLGERSSVTVMETTDSATTSTTASTLSTTVSSPQTTTTTETRLTPASSSAFTATTEKPLVASSKTEEKISVEKLEKKSAEKESEPDQPPPLPTPVSSSETSAPFPPSVPPVAASESTAQLVASEGKPPAIPDEPKTLVLPAYTPEIIEGILRAYGIQASPDAKLSRDQRGEFELTAYPLQALTEDCFLKDVLHYWQAKKGRLENRRVAYLFSSSHHWLGLVVQWSAPKTALASQLWQAQSTARTAAVSELLENKALTVSAPQCYEQVQVTVLGVSAQSGLLNQLKKPLNKVFRGQLPISFKAIPVNALYPLVLLEDILNLLQQGQTHPIDLAVVSTAHRERCLQALATRWTQIEQENLQLQQSLVETLRTLLVYATLQTQRRSRYGLTGEDRTTLRQLQARDQAAKHYFYAQRFPDQNILFQGLPLTILAAFLRTPDAAAWLPLLNPHRDALRRELLVWELTLKDQLHNQKQTMCAYLTEKATDSLQFIYRYSFIGFGGELFRLLGQSLFQEIEQDETAMQSIAKTEAKGVHQVVQTVTRSESLAAQSEQSVLVFLGKAPLSRSLGVLGAGLGGLFQIYLGPYALGRMLVISALTLQLHLRVQAGQVNEGKAVISEEAWSVTALHRLSHVLFHGVEAYGLGSTVPLISAAGGLAGSAGASALARRFKPKTPVPQTRAVPTETPGLGWLMLSIVGASLGQSGALRLYGLLLSVQQRLLYRETAMALLTHAASHQPALRELKIDFPSLRYSPSLWFNARNPLSLTWTTQTGALREAHCEIQGLPVLTPQGIIGLICEGNVPSEELSTTLGLPRP